MQHDWIQDRDNEIDPEASKPQVIDPKKIRESQRARKLRGGAKKRRSKKPQGAKAGRQKPSQSVFHDDNLRDEQPPHFATALNVSHDF